MVVALAREVVSALYTAAVWRIGERMIKIIINDA